MKLKRNILSQWACIIGSILCIGAYFLFQNGQESHSTGKSITFVLEVSQSMNVEDIDGVSRLQTAKDYITKILQNTPAGEASLTVFAGDSMRILPFTQDKNLFLTFLRSVDEYNVTKQGTRIDLALEDALQNFYEKKNGTIVLLSDGGDEKIMLSSNLKDTLQESNLDIYIVGVGTQKWWYIPTGDIFSPYKLFAGKPVISKLWRDFLHDISSQLGWTYLSYTQYPQLQNVSGLQDGVFSFWILLAFLFWALFLGLYYNEFYK